jgi:hypothetical protein
VPLGAGADWLEDRRFADEHHRLMDELEANGDLEVLVELTGATREQLRATELAPLAAFELLHRMMARLGIDAGDTASDVDALAEAQWRCRLCGNWRKCRHWLEGETADAGYRDFCGNAALLDRMRTRLRVVPTSEA